MTQTNSGSSVLVKGSLRSPASHPPLSLPPLSHRRTFFPSTLRVWLTAGLTCLFLPAHNAAAVQPGSIGFTDSALTLEEGATGTVTVVGRSLPSRTTVSVAVAEESGEQIILHNPPDSGTELRIVLPPGSSSLTVTVEAPEDDDPERKKVHTIQMMTENGPPAEPSAPGPKFQDCDECPEMIVVPAGSFSMGSPTGRPEVDRNVPAHTVTISRPFAVGVYEVTFDEWDACVEDGGCGGYSPLDSGRVRGPGWGRGTRPVFRVSWHDAKAYLSWLSQKTKKPYRLLTEAEWEYAARAWTTTVYSFGNTITSRDANSRASGFRRTTPVGSYPPNAFGLHDVHGNVEEWTEDCWHWDYYGAPEDGSAWLWTHGGNCLRRVSRGGDYSSTTGSAGRSYSVASSGSGGTGFRVALTLAAVPATDTPRLFIHVDVIVPANDPPTLAFAEPVRVTLEEGQTTQLTVTAMPPPSEDVAVSLLFDGSDIRISPSLVIIRAGQSMAIVPVTARDDGIMMESAEEVAVRLSLVDSQAFAQIDQGKNEAVIAIPADMAQPGFIGFADSALTLEEGATGTVTVVGRSLPSRTTVSITVAEESREQIILHNPPDSGTELRIILPEGSSSLTITVEAPEDDDSELEKAYTIQMTMTGNGPPAEPSAPDHKFQDCYECPEMVVVPAGSFLMGSSNAGERPVHTVRISRPFAVGVYEVTFDEWDACGGCVNNKNPSDEGWGRGTRPVINVSWNDAKEYVAWLSRRTGEEYRLLTEAEWEYAARAGTRTPFHFGNTISTYQANYDGTYFFSPGKRGIYRGQTVPVGSFPANKFGLHDVHGNVAEWVEDCWHRDYEGAPDDGSAWLTEGGSIYHPETYIGDCGRRILRGGHWGRYSTRLDVRSAHRFRGDAGARFRTMGFRVARTSAAVPATDTPRLFMHVDVIVPANDPPILAFAEPVRVTLEEGQTTQLTVTAMPPPSEDVAVSLLFDGSDFWCRALFGCPDIRISPNPIVIRAGQSMGAVPVTAIDDGIMMESAEEVAVRLSLADSQAFAQIDQGKNEAVIAIPADMAQPGFIGFADSALTLEEGATGTVTVVGHSLPSETAVNIAVAEEESGEQIILRHPPDSGTELRIVLPRGNNSLTITVEAPEDDDPEREKIHAIRMTTENGPPAEPLEGTEPSTPGTKFQDCDECPEMIVVPAGSFSMGSPPDEIGRNADEGPVHTVTISEPFAVGIHEVTFDEWDACAEDGRCTGLPSVPAPNDRGWGRGNRPVIHVNWNDAKEYVAWLSRETGKPYRLLTEAEWEYAARAETTTAYSFGNAISADQANYNRNFENGRTAPVGSYKPNDFGLHDVHGNAWEWVEDCWHGNYNGAPADGSAWLEGDRSRCLARVLRGGSRSSEPQLLRSAYRLWAPYYQVSPRSLGFRVALTLAAAPATDTPRLFMHVDVTVPANDALTFAFAEPVHVTLEEGQTTRLTVMAMPPPSEDAAVNLLFDGSDIKISPNPAAIRAGQSMTTVAVTAEADGLTEPAERIAVSLSLADPRIFAQIDQDSGQAVVILKPLNRVDVESDDFYLIGFDPERIEIAEGREKADTEVTLFISPEPPIPEGSSVVVTLNSSSTKQLTVEPGSVAFTSTTLQHTVTVTVLPDKDSEDEEVFTIGIETPQGIPAETTPLTVVVPANDQTVRIRIRVYLEGALRPQL